MALILNIETATTNCSVALSSGKEVICLKEEAELGYSHGEKLHLYIDALFKETGYSPNSLDAIAVSKGPGSYTGLRIGVSSAKGFCYALDKPLIATSTLEALARQVTTTKPAYIIPILDARRMEVYSAIYNNDFVQERKIRAEILTEDIYNTYIGGERELYIIGNATEKTKTILNKKSGLVYYVNALPSASEMAIISAHKYRKGDMENVAYFEPYYLKDFIAIKPKPLF